MGCCALAVHLGAIDLSCFEYLLLMTAWTLPDRVTEAQVMRSVGES